MIPLSDGLSPRRFPIVTTAIIVVNVAVWLLYELPNLNSAIEHASFYPWSTIAAVLGAYFILFPGAQIRGLIGFWPVTLSAWLFLGFCFLYQLFEANFGLFESSDHGGGVAFFAHVGGFVFGAVVARALLARGRLQDDRVPRGVWA